MRVTGCYPWGRRKKPEKTHQDKEGNPPRKEANPAQGMGAGLAMPHPWPNKALEPTAPRVAFTYAAVSTWRGGSPQAFGGPRGGGWRRGVPMRSGVARRLARHSTRDGRLGHAGRRRAPWERGASPGQGVLTPTEQRTGADRATGGLSPAAVRTWRGGSLRALGASLCAQFST